MADAETHVMWSVAQIAERDGVTKQAVSKAVQGFLGDHPETPVERDGRGRVLRLSLAHYDHYRQRYVNPAKATAPIRSAASESATLPVNPGESFEEARRQSEWLKVGREKLRHQEDSGQLVRRDKVVDASKRAGEAIKLVVMKLQNRADDLAIAVSKEGAHGARVLLRKISSDIGNDVADELARLSVTAPEYDPPIDEETENSAN